jgi:hypothetical protein
MTDYGLTRRCAAALVALVYWSALSIQFSRTFASTQSVTQALWFHAQFFTFLAGVLVAAAMTWVAVGRRVSPFLLGGSTV